MDSKIEVGSDKKLVEVRWVAEVIVGGWGNRLQGWSAKFDDSPLEYVSKYRD